jgi:excisionase family DNA binding protein
MTAVVSEFKQAESARRWLNVEQAAAYLGVVAYTIRDATWKGELLAAKLGNRLIYDRTDLDAWAQSKKRLETAFR